MQNYHSLPDLTGYETKAAKKIRKLAKEHAEKTRELGALGSEVEEARRGLEDARNRDTEARALAARKGGADPGRHHEEQARARLEELQDRLSVMERVVADVERDLSAAITEGKGAIIEEARRKREEAGKAYTQAHRAMREAHDVQRHHAGVVQWAYRGSGYFGSASPNSAVLSVPDTLPDDDPERRVEIISSENAPGLLRGA